MRTYLGFLLFLLPATAPVSTALADPAPTVVEMSYDGYASGFHVMTMSSTLTIGPAGYRIDTSGHTAGMVSVMYHARWHTVADGVWAGAGVQPHDYDNDGVFGGQPRHVAFDYVNGDPVLRVLQPPDDHEHGPVPAAMEHHTLDGLAVLALAIHQIIDSGTCSGSVTSFDGRAVEQRTLRTTGMEQLPATSRSSWQGPALRCDMESRIVAGFFHNDSTEAQHPYVDTVWFARPAPNLPPLPVRFTATTHYTGRTTLYLTGISVQATGTQTATQP